MAKTRKGGRGDADAGRGAAEAAPSTADADAPPTLLERFSSGSFRLLLALYVLALVADLPFADLPLDG